MGYSGLAKLHAFSSVDHVLIPNGGKIEIDPYAADINDTAVELNRLTTLSLNFGPHANAEFLSGLVRLIKVPNLRKLDLLLKYAGRDWSDLVNCTNRLTCDKDRMACPSLSHPVMFTKWSFPLLEEFTLDIQNDDAAPHILRRNV